MRGKKILFLFLGLGMPIIVFLFLKMFGRNQFEVPLPEIQPAPECHFTNPESYIVSDSIIGSLTEESFELLVINFGPQAKKLDRITESFPVEVVKVEVRALGMARERLERIKKCGFFLQSPNNAVLLDNQKKIRGYYDGTDRDELDRLEAEIKIILKKY
jgi:hypothetical protein